MEEEQPSERSFWKTFSKVLIIVLFLALCVDIIFSAIAISWGPETRCGGFNAAGVGGSSCSWIEALFQYIFFVPIYFLLMGVGLIILLGMVIASFVMGFIFYKLGIEIKYMKRIIFGALIFSIIIAFCIAVPNVYSEIKDKIAIANGNPEACGWRNPDPCIYNIAYNQGNAQYCELMKGGIESETVRSRRQMCYSDMAKLTNDSSFCSKAHKSDMDECYISISKNTLNESLCGLITSKERRDACLAIFVAERGNLQECDSLDISLSISCRMQIAFSKKDPSICEKLYTLDYKPQYQYQEEQMAASKDTCYRSIAKSAGDESICLKIKEGLQREWCYADVAATTGNADLCAKVTESYGHVVCPSIL